MFEVAPLIDVILASTGYAQWPFAPTVFSLFSNSFLTVFQQFFDLSSDFLSAGGDGGNAHSVSLTCFSEANVQSESHTRIPYKTQPR